MPTEIENDLFDICLWGNIDSIKNMISKGYHLDLLYNRSDWKEFDLVKNGTLSIEDYNKIVKQFNGHLKRIQSYLDKNISEEVTNMYKRFIYKSANYLNDKVNTIFYNMSHLTIMNNIIFGALGSYRIDDKIYINIPEFILTFDNEKIIKTEILIAIAHELIHFEESKVLEQINTAPDPMEYLSEMISVKFILDNIDKFDIELDIEYLKDKLQFTINKYKDILDVTIPLRKDDGTLNFIPFIKEDK